MPSSSSISSSERAVALQSTRTAFARRVARFLLPYALVSTAVVAIAMRTGELLPTRTVAWLTTWRVPFLYLNEFSDHTYSFKLLGTRQQRPEILAIGGSRVNQFRSAMFAPYGFFSASNSLYSQYDYRRFLEDVARSHVPRVVLFTLDFYTFNPAYEAFFKNVSYDELGGWGSPEQQHIVRSLLKHAVSAPMELVPFQREPLHGVPALGLQAARTGTGFRIDGSYQYGGIIRGDPKAGAATVDNALKRVNDGVVPFLHAERMDAERMREVERFAALGQALGIALVAITMPYAPPVHDALNRSASHGIHQEFHSDRTRAWLEKLGIVYFDFSRLESFGGHPDEFVDPFHPTETAFLRMLTVMLQDKRFAALLPKIDPNALRRRLDAKATRFEVYRNEF